MLAHPYDRIAELVPGVSARAVRSVSLTDKVFDTHFPTFPVLPGVFLMLGMSELAGALTQHSWPDRGAPILQVAEAVRFRRWVRPGDQVMYECQVVSAEEERVILTAAAKVDGTLAASIRRLHFRFGLRADGERP